MPLTIHDLPARFAQEYGRLFNNRPFYVSIGEGERQGPFLFRPAPDRLVPIGEHVAWAMLRQECPNYIATYYQWGQVWGRNPDPYQLADCVSLAVDEPKATTYDRPEPRLPGRDRY